MPKLQQVHPLSILLARFKVCISEAGRTSMGLGKIWRRQLALYLAVLSSIGFIQPTLSKANLSAAPMREVRGVWLTNIDSEVLFSGDRLQSTLRQLSKLNFNTVYPTVWNWGYTLYPSAAATRTIGVSQRLYPDLGNTGQADPREGQQHSRDMLRELTTLAPRYRLSVIPWFEFGFMAPARSDLAQKHPDWLTQRRDGNPIIMEGDAPRVWLNPLHPEVQQFLADLVTEVAAQYDIHGIQLDDHFGLPVELGYDPYTIALYRQEHQGKLPPANPRDTDWMRWRANKITAALQKVFRALKAQKPGAILSLSPNPAPFAYSEFLQDWVAWERQGYIEELVLQVYRRDRNRFLMELSRPEVEQARQHIPVSIGILAGLNRQPVSMNWIQQQIRWVRDRQFAGVSFFFYDTLWASPTESEQQRKEKLSTLFQSSAFRPTAFTP
ncbi:MAG TPA: glycoside hydrolase family 10 protein [Stenomitos sp.]